MLDPEAAKIALTADFPSITIAGNVANQVISTQEFLDEVYEVKNPYSEIMHSSYGTIFPFWDETAMALMVDPSLATNTTTCRFYSCFVMLVSTNKLQYISTLIPPTAARIMVISMFTKMHSRL